MSTPGSQGRSIQHLSPISDPDSVEDIDPEFADIFIHLREADDARARAGDIRGLWNTAENNIAHLSSRFVTEPDVDFSGAWAPQLQNLWHLYYVAGRHCVESTVASLVIQILETSSRGMLSRSRLASSGEVEREYAPLYVRTGDDMIQQYLWQDLPMLVPNMTSYWMRDFARMSRSQRVRLSHFLASLAAASTAQWAYGLCGIALLVLRDTLESDRRLVRAIVEPGGEDSENNGRSVDMLTIADLLLAVDAWLMRAGKRIVQLCEVGDGTADGSLSALIPEQICQTGPLAAEAGVQSVTGGFSSQRWLFWLRRLDEIGGELAGYENENVSPFVQRVRTEKQVARQVARNMIYAASQSDSNITQELVRMGRLPL
ncbi:hypothetical protein F5Y15DRAFT_195433 [Xylariaceae sp. FL0016]|nr:hypothetical protein F5Y15DRAFT_195433 [Xylariaceae sp. FL0016]